MILPDYINKTAEEKKNISVREKLDGMSGKYKKALREFCILVEDDIPAVRAFDKVAEKFDITGKVFVKLVEGCIEAGVLTKKHNLTEGVRIDGAKDYLSEIDALFVEDEVLNILKNPNSSDMDEKIREKLDNIEIEKVMRTIVDEEDDEQTQEFINDINMDDIDDSDLADEIERQKKDVDMFMLEIYRNFNNMGMQKVYVGSNGGGGYKLKTFKEEGHVFRDLKEAKKVAEYYNAHMGREKYMISLIDKTNGEIVLQMGKKII